MTKDPTKITEPTTPTELNVSEGIESIQEMEWLDNPLENERL